jgi:hypothetical protein
LTTRWNAALRTSFELARRTGGAEDAVPTHGDPGYTLADGSELTTLVQEILTAMAQGTMITVTLEASLTGKGIPALSGASLAYAVLCPRAVPAGPAYTPGTKGHAVPRAGCREA